MYGVTRVIRLVGRTSNSTGILFSRKQTLSNATPWLLQRANVHNSPVNDPLGSTPFIQQLDNVNDSIEETSSQAKWMADAAVSLPSQGDLASVGLGGHSPIGLLQSTLEWMHVTVGLPWWVSIVSCTLVLRLALFPVTIRLQRNAARMNNIRPQMDKFMAKIKEYQQSGNQMMAAQESSRLMKLYKDHNCNPIKMLVGPFLQVPIFLSFFVAIRRMATLPVESMKTGGALWFTDLTLPDPFYMLPIASCVSFIATIELGGETGVTNPQVEKMKFFFRCMAIMLIPVTASFPTGVFMYWLTASVFSLTQILILKIPSIRVGLKIPPIIKHPQPATAGNAGGRPGSGIINQLKESYRNAVLVDTAKHKDAVAKKEYKKLLKTDPAKLYDDPPHKRSRSKY